MWEEFVGGGGGGGYTATWGLSYDWSLDDATQLYLMELRKILVRKLRATCTSFSEGIFWATMSTIFTFLDSNGRNTRIHTNTHFFFQFNNNCVGIARHGKTHFFIFLLILRLHQGFPKVVVCMRCTVFSVEMNGNAWSAPPPSQKKCVVRILEF